MFVLLGSNGNITSKTARILLSQGQAVRVVGRSASALGELKEAGAEIAVGDIANAAFLTDTFRGADAVYTMIPPQYAAADMLAAQEPVGKAIVQAIASSGVTRVVNLSSTGAHEPAGTGPIVTLHRQEQRLNQLDGVNVLHLRPGYFFENHFNAIGTIKALGVYADMMESGARIPSIATADIAKVLARELVNFNTRGKAILHLRGPALYSQAEAASILGQAIGKPDLKHVQADPAHAKAGMVQHGLSANVADLFEEMSRYFSTGSALDAVAAGPTEVTDTSLEHFAATVFAPVYQGGL